MSPPVLELLPLGPFPPRGPAAPPGQLDLGAALRDQLFARGALEGPLRQALQGRVAQAIEREDFDTAATLLQAWIDSWPVAAAVDPARSEWGAAPSAAALAVLGRAAELAGHALGWARLPGTPWPSPPGAWIQREVAGRPVRLVGRGPRDHRALVEAAIGQQVEEDRGDPLPALAEVAGTALAARRAELSRALVRGELAAVLSTTPVPPDAESQLALGELRLEGRAQRAVEHYGPGAAWVDGWVDWSEIPTGAPAGEPGAVLQAVADSLLTPGTPEQLRQGQLETTGWLVWSAPFQPVAVVPAAVTVLRALDGERDAAAIAELVKGPLDGVQQVLDALVELGAATAAH